jgi:hypothetical protein
VTTALSDQEHIRQAGSERCDWLQAAEKPGAQGRKEGARRFRIKCGVGVRTLGGTRPCPVKLLCCGLSPASMPGSKVFSSAQLARATVNWTVDNSYFTAELLGKGRSCWHL